MSTLPAVARINHSTPSSVMCYNVPVEIIEMVIRLVKDQKGVLARCSAASKLLASIAEPLLYVDIMGVLSQSKDKASIGLFGTLEASHRRRRYVHTLAVVIAREAPSLDYRMPYLTFPNLKTLALFASTGDDTVWFYSEPYAVQFCQRLMVQPQLQKLTVSGLWGIAPRVLFLPCRLKSLTLNNTSVLCDHLTPMFDSQWDRLETLEVFHTAFDNCCRSSVFLNPTQKRVAALQDVVIRFSAFDFSQDLEYLMRICGPSVKTLIIETVEPGAEVMLMFDKLDLSALTGLRSLTLNFPCWPELDIVEKLLDTVSKLSPLTNMILKADNVVTKDDWNGSPGFVSAVTKLNRDSVESSGLLVVLTGDTEERV